MKRRKPLAVNEEQFIISLGKISHKCSKTDLFWQIPLIASNKLE